MSIHVYILRPGLTPLSIYSRLCFVRGLWGLAGLGNSVHGRHGRASGLEMVSYFFFFFFAPPRGTNFGSPPASWTFSIPNSYCLVITTYNGLHM